MINHPEVTVVMPVFNTEAYVDSAVESVLGQTFGNFELLLINDGSTDASLLRLERWAKVDGRIHLFSQANQGLSGARNTGIAHARGDFIYFMDSDDIITKDTLHTCYEYCKNNELDFVFFDAEVFADGFQNAALTEKFNYKRSLTKSKILSGYETFANLLKHREFFSSACLLFINRSFLNKIGLLFEKSILHEDELFTSMLFLEAQRTCYIPASFFLRRVRANSIMTINYSMKNINSYFVVGTKLLEYAKKNSKLREVIDPYLKEMIDAAVWKAHGMPLKRRTNIFMICLRRWRRYVKIKTLFALLFKKYIGT